MVHLLTDCQCVWQVGPNGKWEHWRHHVPAWVYPKHEENPKFAQLVIPTLDSVRSLPAVKY